VQSLPLLNTGTVRQCAIYFFYSIIGYEKNTAELQLLNSDLTPQGVENRNILLWFKCVLTALHVNCMILFDKRERDIVCQSCKQ
jgi:hypothetical protein